jgi:hypothetical protein
MSYTRTGYPLKQILDVNSLVHTHLLPKTEVTAADCAFRLTCPEQLTGL